MTKFSYDQSLPSLRVTKDLLESLESYLAQRIATSCSLTVDEARKLLSITIEDNLGTEHFSSVNQFHTTRFSDSTKRVVVEIGAHSEGVRLQLRLQFSRGRMLSSMSISATAPNSRELVAGLKDGILRVLEPCRTWHWICNPSAEMWGALIAIFLVLVFLQWKLDASHPVSSAVSIGIFILWLLGVLPYLRPYMVFDSRVSERSDKIWNWFFTGLMTFLVFGTLFVLIREGVLGF